MKVREAFSNLPRFIGWEELCECRPEAKVPHLFHRWQMRASTRYEYFWLWKLCLWNLLSPGFLCSALFPHGHGIRLFQAQVSLLTSLAGSQALLEWLQGLSLLLSNCVVPVGWCYFPATAKSSSGDFWCPAQLACLVNWNLIQRGESRLAWRFMSAQVHSVLWVKRSSSF